MPGAPTPGMDVPEEFADLFERPSITTLATVLPDGSPHVVPVWSGYDGEHVGVVTREGTRKLANVRENPAVSLSVIDPGSQYRYLFVRGRVVGIDPDGALDYVDDLARRYWGVEEYPYHRNEDRYLLSIRPDVVRGRTVEPPADAEVR